MQLQSESLTSDSIPAGIPSQNKAGIGQSGQIGNLLGLLLTRRGTAGLGGLDGVTGSADSSGEVVDL